ALGFAGGGGGRRRGGGGGGRTPEAAAWPGGGECRRGGRRRRPLVQEHALEGACGAAGEAGGGDRPLRCRPGQGPGGVPAGADLDLADQVQGRGEGLLAFLPLGRADLTRVGGDVLGGLDLAQQVLRVAADALGDRKST